jgi:hypothetical protein
MAEKQVTAAGGSDTATRDRRGYTSRPSSARRILGSKKRGMSWLARARKELRDSAADVVHPPGGGQEIKIGGKTVVHHDEGTGRSKAEIRKALNKSRAEQTSKIRQRIIKQREQRPHDEDYENDAAAKDAEDETPHLPKAKQHQLKSVIKRRLVASGRGEGVLAPMQGRERDPSPNKPYLGELGKAPKRGSSNVWLGRSLDDEDYENDAAAKDDAKKQKPLVAARRTYAGSRAAEAGRIASAHAHMNLPQFEPTAKKYATIAAHHGRRALGQDAYRPATNDTLAGLNAANKEFYK